MNHSLSPADLLEFRVLGAPTSPDHDTALRAVLRALPIGWIIEFADNSERHGSFEVRARSAAQNAAWGERVGHRGRAPDETAALDALAQLLTNSEATTMRERSTPTGIVEARRYPAWAKRLLGGGAIPRATIYDAGFRALWGAVMEAIPSGWWIECTNALYPYPWYACATAPYQCLDSDGSDLVSFGQGAVTAQTPSAALLGLLRAVETHNVCEQALLRSTEAERERLCPRG